MSFQARVSTWVAKCFGSKVAYNATERNHRFLEEALELVQSCGCSRDDAIKLVDYVYGREVGDPKQECGGVMVTLAALGTAHGLVVADCGENELVRCWNKIDLIRAKQARKIKDSALPGLTQED